MTPLMLLPAVPVTDCLVNAETYYDCDFQKRYGFYVPNSNPLRYSQNYIIRSGTSFAAPVGAGAALIASRVFSATPSAATPALIKAMLTATARSLNGGLNYAVNGDTTANVVPQTIGPAPNDVQGFGRIDISDIIDSTIPKSYVNQEPQTILGQGGVWVRSYIVSRDGLPVKIATAWSDAPSSDVSQSPVTVLTNNLDLEVRRENGVTCSSYLGNNISATEESITYDCASGFADGKNNVEKVVFSAPSSTIFTVIVRASTLLQRAIPCAAEPCSTTPAQDFALYVQNASEVSSLPAPTLTSATGSSTSVTVSWTTVQGAAKYQLYRGLGGGAMQQIASCPGDPGCTSAVSYVDTSLPPSFYKYAVSAVNAGGAAASVQSNFDVAWVGSFTDDPLIAGTTIVKADHILELRSLINQLRAIAGLSAFGFSTTVAPLEVVRATDVVELRAALDQARQTLSQPPLSYANVVASGQFVRAVDIREIRDGLR
jgi:hypothetical protein